MDVLPDNKRIDAASDGGSASSSRQPEGKVRTVSARRTSKVTRLLIIVQNLPVPFDRRVWLECQALTAAGYHVSVVCPKGKGDPSREVIQQVELFKYRPYAPGGSKIGFITEYVYSFAATLWLTLKARRSGRLG